MKRPFVFINVAMTLDGKIDTFARKGSTISSPRDKARVNQLRAEADAVMVGGRTLLDEDPKLTVKSEALRAERIARGLPANPLKVGVVSEANIESHAEFLHAGGSRVVLFTTSRTAKDQLDLLRSQGADVFVHAGEHVDLPQAMNTLAELGVKRLMVEGGAIINFELLRLGLVDEVHAFVAPMIFGGQSAPTLASGAGLERSADAISLNLLNAETWEDGGVLLTYSVKQQRE